MTEPSLGGVKAWTVWVLSILFVIILFSFQSGYSIVNPSVQKDVGLTVTQVGLIAATYTWSFALFQFFSGALLDRLGARRVLLPAIAIFTIGVFTFAHATSVEMIILAQLILALGACSGFVGAGYIGGQWFGMAKFSFMFGLVQCLASLFSAFGQNLFGAALKSMQWPELFTWIGCAGVVLWIAGWMGIRDPAPTSGLGRGFVSFLRDVLADILAVARVGRVWVAAAFGAFVFGALLANGVVWAPKLMQVRGMPADTANLAASVLWLGLAVGCIVFPWWSDAIRRRKTPVIAGIAIQLAAILTLVYASELGTFTAMALWFAFGIGAAAHMLAFSMAGDVVKPALIGTSAALVNGTMFLVSGVLIARPGAIVSHVAHGAPVTMEIVAVAARPIIGALLLALLLATIVRETYPQK